MTAPPMGFASSARLLYMAQQACLTSTEELEAIASDFKVWAATQDADRPETAEFARLFAGFLTAVALFPLDTTARTRGGH